MEQSSLWAPLLFSKRLRDEEIKIRGQTFTARVEHLSSQGLGVIKTATGQVFFAREVWPGDVGSFRAEETAEGRYQFATLEKLISPAPTREIAFCPHFGSGADQCYGCPWQIASYEAQLEQKEHRLRYAFERVGLALDTLLPIWPAPATLGYRRRAQFKTDGKILGYAGRQGLAIAPVDRCQILEPRLHDTFIQLKAQLPRDDWRPDPPYIWNFIELESGSSSFQLNRRLPFAQANAAQNQRMRDWLQAQLDSFATPLPVLELFAGSGNFTEVLVAQGWPTIAAYEVGAAAVAALKARSWPGVEAQVLDLFKASALSVLARDQAETQLLLVNPPRSGLLQMARLPQRLADLHTILYISCEVKSLAQDLKKLERQGFKPRTVQPLDQMPHTPHLEVLVRLERF